MDSQQRETLIKDHQNGISYRSLAEKYRVSCPEIGLHISSKLMDSQQRETLIKDHRNGISYRSLAEKYGVSLGTAHNIVMPKKKNQGKDIPHDLPPYKPESLPDDIDELKEALRKARLKIELQDLMLDISSKELGIDLRKKHGTRRSK